MLADSARPTFDQRALAGTPITTGFGYVDAEGEPAEAPATPSVVSCTNLNGDTLTVGTVETIPASGDRPEAFKATIEADQVGNVADILTVVWGVGTARFTKLIGVQAGYLFTLADARRRFPDRKHSDDKIRLARYIVEAEADRVLRGRSMTPKARTVTLPIPTAPFDKLILPDWDIRTIRAVTITRNGSTDVYTTDELAGLHPNAAGIVERVGNTGWPSRPGTVTVTYEYGLHRPPDDVQQAALRRLEFWLSEPTAILPSFSTGYTMPDTGAQHRFSSNMDTGDMTVDRIYSDHARRIVPIA